jgi:hypothetical protein
MCITHPANRRILLPNYPLLVFEVINKLLRKVLICHILSIRIDLISYKPLCQLGFLNSFIKDDVLRNVIFMKEDVMLTLQMNRKSINYRKLSVHRKFEYPLARLHRTNVASINVLFNLIYVPNLDGGLIMTLVNILLIYLMALREAHILQLM